MRHAEILRQALPAKLGRIAARDIFQLLARWAPEVGLPGKSSPKLGRQGYSSPRSAVVHSLRTQSKAPLQFAGIARWHEVHCGPAPPARQGLHWSKVRAPILSI